MASKPQGSSEKLPRKAKTSNKGKPPRKGGKKEKSKGPKQPKEQTVEEKAVSLSKKNGKERKKLVLGSYLKPKEFLELCEQTGDLPVQNGKQANPHAVDAAVRKVLIADLHLHLSRSNKTAKDLQGAGRGTGLFVDNQYVPYFHNCRGEITTRDIGHVTHHFDECPQPPADVTVSVDVAGHLTEQELLHFIELGRDRVHFAVMHDVARREGQKGELVPTGDDLMWTREVDGHCDHQPDRWQPFMLKGGFPTNDGRFVGLREWGRTFHKSSHVIMVFRICNIDVQIPKLSVSMSDFFGHTPSIGVYDLDLVPGFKTAYVLREYLVLETTIGQHLRFPRDSAALIGKALFGKPVTARTVDATKRKLRVSTAKLDEHTTDRCLDAMLRERTVKNQHRLGWITKVMSYFGFNSSVDSQAIINETTAPYVARYKPTSWGFDPRKVLSLLKSVPMLLKLAPLLYFVWRYYRREPTTLFGRAIKAYRYRTAVDTALGFRKKLEVSATPSWKGVFTNVKTLFKMRFGMGSLTSVIGLTIGKGGGGVLADLVYTGLQKCGFSRDVCSLAPKLVTIPSVVAGVVCEEAFKGAIKPWVSHTVFAGSELGLRVFAKGLPGVFIGFPAFYMHYSIQNLPLKERILIHSLFNLYVSYHEWRLAPKYQEGITGPVSLDGFKGYVKSGPIRPTEEGSRLTVSMDRKRVTLEQLDMIENERELVFPNLIVASAFRPKCQANHPLNFAVGMHNRCMFEREVVAEPGRWVQGFHEIGRFCEGEPIPFVTFEFWNSRYDARRKCDNLAALELILDGRETYHMNDPFLKAELNHSTDENLKDPRVIIPPADNLTKVVEGPFVYSVSKTMCHLFDGHKIHETEDGIRVVILIFSGIDQENLDECQAARASNFVNRVMLSLEGHQGCSLFIMVSGDDSWMAVLRDLQMVIVCADAKRWDAHYREEPLTLERELFLELGRKAGYQCTFVSEDCDLSYGTVQEVRKSLFQGVTPHISSSAFSNIDVSFTGKMLPMRTSGSQLTSAGNNCANAGALIVIGRKLLSIDITDHPLVTTTLVESWAEFGMDVTTNVSTCPSDTDFCSCYFIPNGEYFYMIPKIGRFVSRNGWSVGSARTESEMRSMIEPYMKYKEVPILGQIVQRAHFLLGSGPIAETPKMLYNNHYGSGNEFPPPTDETWEWFLRFYDVTEEDVTAFAAELQEIYVLPYSVDPPFYKKLIEVDLELDLAGSIVPVFTNTMNALLQILGKMSAKGKSSKQSSARNRRPKPKLVKPKQQHAQESTGKKAHRHKHDEEDQEEHKLEADLKRDARRPKGAIEYSGKDSIQNQFLRYNNPRQEEVRRLLYEACLLDPEGAEPTGVEREGLGEVSESVKLKIRLSQPLAVPTGETTVMMSFWNNSGPTSMGHTNFPLTIGGAAQPYFIDNRLPFMTAVGLYNPTVIATPSTSQVPFYGVPATVGGGTSFQSMNWPLSLGVDLKGCSGRVVSQEVRVYSTSNKFVTQGTGYVFQPTLAMNLGINSDATFTADIPNLYALQGMQVCTASLPEMDNEEYFRALRFPQTDNECNWLTMDYRDTPPGNFPADANLTNVPWCVFAASECAAGQTFRVEIHYVIELVDQDYSFASTNVPSITGPITALELSRHSGPQIHNSETADANNAASMASSEAAVMGPRKAGGFLDFMGEGDSHVANMAKEAASAIVEPAIGAATDSAGEIIGEILAGVGAIFGLSRKPSRVITTGETQDKLRLYHPWSKIPQRENTCPGKAPIMGGDSAEAGATASSPSELAMIGQFVFKSPEAIVLRTVFVRPGDRAEKFVSDRILTGKCVPASLPGLPPTSDWEPLGHYTLGGVEVPVDSF